MSKITMLKSWNWIITTDKESNFYPVKMLQLSLMIVTSSLKYLQWFINNCKMI